MASKFVKPLVTHFKTALKLKLTDNNAKQSDALFVFEGIGTMTSQDGSQTLGAIFRPVSMTYGAVTLLPLSVMEAHAKQHPLPEWAGSDFGWLDSRSTVYKQAFAQITQEKALIDEGKKTYDQYPQLNDLFKAALDKQQISIDLPLFHYKRTFGASVVFGEVKKTPKL